MTSSLLLCPPSTHDISLHLQENTSAFAGMVRILEFLRDLPTVCLTQHLTHTMAFLLVCRDLALCSAQVPPCILDLVMEITARVLYTCPQQTMALVIAAKPLR